MPWDLKRKRAPELDDEMLAELAKEDPFGIQQSFEQFAAQEIPPELYGCVVAVLNGCPRTMYPIVRYNVRSHAWIDGFLQKVYAHSLWRTKPKARTTIKIKEVQLLSPTKELIEPLVCKHPNLFKTLYPSYQNVSIETALKANPLNLWFAADTPPNLLQLLNRPSPKVFRQTVLQALVAALDQKQYHKNGRNFQLFRSLLDLPQWYSGNVKPPAVHLPLVLAAQVAYWAAKNGSPFNFNDYLKSRLGERWEALPKDTPIEKVLEKVIQRHPSQLLRALLMARHPRCSKTLIGSLPVDLFQRCVPPCFRADRENIFANVATIVV
jgi:hypothetical protein